MKLKTMENSLIKYPNRFHLTMMAVARAKELNEGETPLVKDEAGTKPVVMALREISEGKIIPATPDEMQALREAKKKVRERALRAAAAEEDLDSETSESIASASPDQST
jgi:DNA-directed RNA polymerase subunit omega